MKSPKTHTQIRKEFAAAGISIKDWAVAHKFSYEVVKAVMCGRLSGQRGESHRVAIALGLKVGRVVEAANFLPPQPKAPRRLAAIKGGRA